jgi:hypothetical protein
LPVAAKLANLSAMLGPATSGPRATSAISKSGIANQKARKFCGYPKIIYCSYGAHVDRLLQMYGASSGGALGRTKIPVQVSCRLYPSLHAMPPSKYMFVLVSHLLQNFCIDHPPPPSFEYVSLVHPLLISTN